MPVAQIVPKHAAEMVLLIPRKSATSQRAPMANHVHQVWIAEDFGVGREGILGARVLVICVVHV